MIQARQLQPGNHSPSTISVSGGNQISGRPPGQSAAYLGRSSGHPAPGWNIPSFPKQATLPPNVPATDPCSFTLYDNPTRSMRQTDKLFPGVDNLDEVRANADGSFDIDFAPRPPAGMESNWIQIVPGKGRNTILRLYGPLESFYDKSWMPGDPEVIE
nr:DUF1214 domain-containing protein [Luteolibacter marinus]